MHFVHMFEGSLEVKLPTIWTNGKAQVGRVREEKRREEKREEKRREEERRSQKRKRQKKVDTGVRKGRKNAKRSVFPMIWGSAGPKIGSLKGRCEAIWPDKR